MDIDKLIEFSKSANVPREFQREFSDMMEIYHKSKKDPTMQFPKEKMEDMLKHLIELIKKDSVIHLELAKHSQLNEILESYSGLNYPHLEEILEMRKNPRYIKHISLLDFIGLAILTININEKQGGDSTAIPSKLFKFVSMSAWEFFVLTLGALVSSSVMKVLIDNDVNPLLAGFIAYMATRITGIMFMAISNVAGVSKALQEEVLEKEEKEEEEEEELGKNNARLSVGGAGALLLTDPNITFKIIMTIVLAVIIVVLLILIVQCICKIYKNDEIYENYESHKNDESHKILLANI
jgi:uncharacterized membrane protein